MKSASSITCSNENHPLKRKIKLTNRYIDHTPVVVLNNCVDIQIQGCIETIPLEDILPMVYERNTKDMRILSDDENIVNLLSYAAGLFLYSTEDYGNA